jgi:hypothetical protein
MRQLLFSLLLFVFGLVAGCESITGLGQNGETLDLRGATSATIDGLAVHLFAPDTVAVADSFEVRVVVQNQTDEKQAVTTPSACLVQPGIFDKEGDRVPFKGSILLCAAAITTHDIPADDTVERRFDIRAVLDTADGEEPAPPGNYVVQTELDWTIGGREIERRDPKREIVVRR